MDRITKDHLRELLRAQRNELQNDDALGAEARGTVTLDQQSVGRLSRMDALQQQAMAQATRRRRGASIMAIDAALARLETEEFGYCAECGEAIALKRLELNPALTTCVSCARG